MLILYVNIVPSIVMANTIGTCCYVYSDNEIVFNQTLIGNYAACGGNGIVLLLLMSIMDIRLYDISIISWNR
jgi:hypothetical protein